MPDPVEKATLPGPQTSEFKITMASMGLTVVSVVAIVILALFDKLTGEVLAAFGISSGASALSSGAYAVSRGLAKGAT